MNRNDLFAAQLIGTLAAHVVVAALEKDFRHYGVRSRAEWDLLTANERAQRARRYARNLLKTVRDTPSSLQNQKEQAEKLLHQVELAHHLDRSVVGFRAVNAVRELERKLRWETGWRPVAVGPIDIS